MFFNPLQKGVILSEAPRRSIAYERVYGAKSKDPEGAYLAHAARSFLTTKARTRPEPRRSFPGDENKSGQHLAMSGGYIYILDSYGTT